MQKLIRKLATVFVCFCLIAMSLVPDTSQAAANASVIASLENAEVEEGARQFDDAVRDMEKILTLDLSNDKDAKQVAAILERNARKLAMIDRKAMHSAMRVSAFKEGLKAEASKRKGGADELAKELKANSEAVTKIEGAEEAAEAIRNAIQPANEKLKKVGDALKKAAEASKKSAVMKGLSQSESHHRRSSMTLTNENVLISAASFCGTYKYICDVLAELGAWYLWGRMRVLTYPSRVNTCIVQSYQKWRNGCTNVGFYDNSLALSLLGCDGWFVFKINSCVQQLF